MDAHGGYLWAESEEGRGSTFQLLFPLLPLWLLLGSRPHEPRGPAHRHPLRQHRRPLDLFSDKLLSWLAQDPTPSPGSPSPRMAYVLVTAALLYWLISSGTPGRCSTREHPVGEEHHLSATEAELRRNMDEYYRKAAQLRLITDMIPALICYVDSTGSYRFVNRRYAQWFGKTPAEIVGRSVQEILGPDLYAQIREPGDRALAARPWDSPKRRPASMARNGTWT